MEREIVYIKNSSFIPEFLSIKCGTTVTFFNDESDLISHEISCKYNKEFPIIVINRGLCFDHQFHTVGKFEISIGSIGVSVNS